MKNLKIKQFALLLGIVLSTAWCQASIILDGYSLIIIKEARVESLPKGSSIQASIDGHTLSIVFLENLGQVSIELEGVDAGEAQYQSTPTPNGVDFYIVGTGSFVVYFTLPNGDVYYGEFEVTD